MAHPETGVAQGVTSDRSDRQTQAVLEKFERWEVRSADGSTSFFLIGSPSDGSGQLWLQCEPGGSMTVAISMTGRAGRKGSQRSQTVHLQVDEQPSREYNFIVFESFVALATEMTGTSDDRVAAFVSALQTVKKTLIVTYDGTSHAFEVTGLPQARERFFGFCGRPRNTPSN